MYINVCVCTCACACEHMCECLSYPTFTILGYTVSGVNRVVLFIITPNSYVKCLFSAIDNSFVCFHAIKYVSSSI